MRAASIFIIEYPENGCSMFLQNVTISVPDYITLHPRKEYSVYLTLLCVFDKGHLHWKWLVALIVFLFCSTKRLLFVRFPLQIFVCILSFHNPDTNHLYKDWDKDLSKIICCQ